MLDPLATRFIGPKGEHTVSMERSDASRVVTADSLFLPPITGLGDCETSSAEQLRRERAEGDRENSEFKAIKLTSVAVEGAWRYGP